MLTSVRVVDAAWQQQQCMILKPCPAAWRHIRCTAEQLLSRLSSRSNACV